jgi:dTDP-4-amino-4,6-dideoxygalactose transaminase
MARPSVGTQGIGGCFSFQATKNMPAGEGGAVVTNDEAFCPAVLQPPHADPHKPAPTSGRGANFRMTEFQAGLLMAQLSRLDDQTRTRDANAAYLTEMLDKIPGVTPVRPASGCTRNAHHMYMLRYDARQFANLPRAKFLGLLNKEGLAASSPYTPLNKTPHVLAITTNRHCLRLYGRKTMAEWKERNQC